jgi:hypothetical protein
VLSGLQRILQRVRVSPDTLRVSVLVAAGVTTGYLWRAAFEASVGQPTGAPANLVTPSPKPPLRIVVPAAPARPSPARRIARRSSLAVATRPPQFVSRTPVPGVRPSPPHKPTPRPATPTSPPPTSPPPTSPPPTSPPPTSPSSPAGGSPPASTPTAAAPAAPAAPRGPTVAVTPPPVVAQPTPQPPGSTDEGQGNGNGSGHDEGGDQSKQGDDDRGGWGHGDKNHDHSGPKGHDDHDD